MCLVPDLTYEYEAYRQGYKYIAGIDEAGRGCLAGPVVAAAVILPVGLTIDGVNDSKKLTPSKREFLFEIIKRCAVSTGVGVVGNEDIDRINILSATIKGDSKSISIASASIIAKVTRDMLMVREHSIFPQYNFITHKGYGTKEHMERLKQFGPSVIHRKSFLKKFLNLKFDF